MKKPVVTTVVVPRHLARVRYEQLLDRMQTLGNGCTEDEHIEADRILCDLLEALGFEDMVAAYRAVPKWHA